MRKQIQLYLCFRVTPRFLLFILLWGFSAHLQAVNRIAIKAFAKDEYLSERAHNEAKKIQTYMVMKGIFREGITRDHTMDRITFEDIVYDMAPHLRRQGYYPLSEPGDSDLLLVVHYGRTSEEVGWDDLMGYTSLQEQGYNDTVINAGANGPITATEMNAIADFQFNMGARQMHDVGNRMSTGYKAQLLGMEDAFKNPDAPIVFGDQRLLQELISQERYYIVVVAYDWPALKTGTYDPLWVTRYSIRAVGQSFPDAITNLNTVAGEYFGKNLKDLTQRRADQMDGVEIGELEVIEYEEKEEEKN